MPRHIEHPGSRHSNPASLNTLSRPSASACCFTSPEPGTTIASLMFAATLRPRTTAAAARKSSMRALVHEPIKTLSSLISLISIPGDRSMYVRARSIHSRLIGSASARGSGTRASTAATICGEVPHVTCGLIALASMWTTRSKCASASLFRSSQAATACSQRLPFGANGRPFT